MTTLIPKLEPPDFPLLKLIALVVTATALIIYLLN